MTTNQLSACEKCKRTDFVLLTRQNPKGEAGIFWCERCTEIPVTTAQDALIAAIEGVAKGNKP